MERLPPFLKFGLSKSLVTLAACIRHYSPRLGRLDWTAVGSALRESHPSEDLSELPPLFETVAGQGYHYRRARALQCSLPRLLWDGREPLGTLLLGPLIEARREKYSPFLIPWLLQVVLARPPNRLSFIQGSSADVIQLPDVLFSRFTEKHLYVPSSVRPSANDF